jgi:hypothetical protein
VLSNSPVQVLPNTSVKYIVLIFIVSWCCFNIPYSLVTSSWSQVRDRYLKIILMFVTVLYVPINHEHRESKYVSVSRSLSIYKRRGSFLQWSVSWLFMYFP